MKSVSKYFAGWENP